MSRLETTPPESVRMFVGYRNASLDIQRYRAELGETFMPGTAYMLQPLGLQAYLPVAIDEALDPLVPHEVALIAYPSQATYQRARVQTLRGRVYTQIHAAVYDLKRSGGSWPSPFEPSAPAPSGSVSLMKNRVDWQEGTTRVLVALSRDGTQGQAFRTTCRDVLASLGDSIRGCDQVLATLHDTCFVVWLHASAESATFEAAEAHIDGRTRIVERKTCERVICLGEFPRVEIKGSAAFNFIFVRDPSAGLW
jgi:hypothetical protein